MSTQAYWNVRINRPHQEVWKEMVNFTAPPQFWTDLKSVKMEKDMPPMTIGAVRELNFKGGPKRYQTVSIDDRELIFSYAEIVGSNGQTNYGERTTFMVSRILSPEKSSILEMRVDFLAGVTGKDVAAMEEKLKGYLELLREGFEKKA